MVKMQGQPTMTDEIIDCWEPADLEIDLTEFKNEMGEWLDHSFMTACHPAIEQWFKKELSHALRELITDDGLVSIDFDENNNNPLITFYACEGYITCSNTCYGGDDLAAALSDVISNHAGDLNDQVVGERNRLRLYRLREVMSEAIKQIGHAVDDC